MSDRNNMKLWNQVCETDPKYTQKVKSQQGRFLFTAIDSQYQIMKATELWGPYGEKWGLERQRFEVYGPEINPPIGISCEATFFCPATNGDVNSFPIAADMPYKPNDECFKKLQTQCISKALSRLGFNADVFLGMFDDNMYVSDQKKKYQNTDKKSGDKKDGRANGNRSNNNSANTNRISGVINPEPTPKQAKVLGKLANEYDKQRAENAVVDYKLLCKKVFEKYGKYPGNAKSIDKILKEIEVKDVTIKNTFLEGVE